MTIFSSSASPGQRWKIYLPNAAFIQSDALSTSTAAALIRGQWLSCGTGLRQTRTIADLSKFQACIGHC